MISAGRLSLFLHHTHTLLSSLSLSLSLSLSQRTHASLGVSLQQRTQHTLLAGLHLFLHQIISVICLCIARSNHVLHRERESVFREAQAPIPTLLLASMGLRKLKIASPAFTHRAKAQEDDLICVTGSWSFVGSWIIKLLLQHGYHVKSTISHTPEEIRGLRSLPQSEMRLEFAEVDLLDYGSLSDHFAGCTGVFYVPSPNYDINDSHDYPMETIDNEVRGVLNVVEACANTSSVRKLVLTSCLSSIMWDRQYYSTGVVLDERNWSDLEFCRKEKMWAALLKTQCEKAAWALARDRGLDLVVINAAVVAGPRQSSGRTSSSMLDQSGIFAYVHVDDLAAAHMLAFEAERASGRYICFEKLLSKADILEAARELYPDYLVAKRLESFNPCVLSNEKLKDLGMRFEQEIVQAEA